MNENAPEPAGSQPLPAPLPPTPSATLPDDARIPTDRRERFREVATLQEDRSIKATSKRVDRQLIATLRPPQSVPNASLMRQQGSNNATIKPPQSASAAGALGAGGVEF